MRRAAPFASLDWTLVTRTRPCCVCGGALGCRWRPDEEFACCTTQPSQWPLTVGGWLHSLPKPVVVAQRGELA